MDPEQKRKAFAAAVFAGAEGKDAAIRAGYSAKTAATAGCRLLKHPGVIAELDRLKGAARSAARGPTRKLSPLEFLLQTVNDPRIDAKLRVRAATAAAQYVHPRRAEGGKREEAAAKAKTAAGRFARRTPPPLQLVRKPQDED